MRTEVFPWYWLVLPGVLFMILFFIAPTLLLFEASFRVTDQYGNMQEGFTLEHYITALSRPYFTGAIVQSLRLAIEATLICCVVGYIVAYSIVHTRSRILKPILYAIVISPLLTSVIARSFGWIVLLTRRGVLNEAMMGLGLIDSPLRMLYTGPATVIAVSQVLIPFAVLPIVSAFSSLNPDVHRASSILGASAFRTFFRVTLPLTLRGIVTGGLLVFALAMGIYITPLLVGGPSRPLLSVRVYEQVLSYFHVSQAAALSFVLLAVTAAIIATVSVVFNSWSSRRLG